MMKKCKSPEALFLVICLILSLTACGGLQKAEESGTSLEEDAKTLPEGSYHIYDYQFFFRNLQQNVEQRINSYMKNIPGKAS